LSFMEPQADMKITHATANSCLYGIFCCGFIWLSLVTGRDCNRRAKLKPQANFIKLHYFTYTYTKFSIQ